MALPNDAYVPVGNTGKKLRTFEETVGANTVQVEALSISDPQVVDAVATVLNAEPGTTEYGLTVRIAGSVHLAASPVIDIGKVDQGLQGTIAQSWFVELTDGTNVLGSAAHPVVVSVNGTAAVSGTVAVSNFPATVAVTQSTSPWVVSGTVTANLGTTGTLVTDANLDEKFGDLGQKNMAGSAPVVIASDQPAIPISGSITATPVADSAPATQAVTALDVATTTATGANNQTFVQGTPTAGSAATFSVASFESLLVEVTNTWTGTLAVEMSYDGGTNYVAAGLHQIGTAFTASSFTGNFIAVRNLAGATHVRARSRTSWTGTATVKVILSVNAASVYIANGLNIQDSTTPGNKLGVLASGAISAGSVLDGVNVNQQTSNTSAVQITASSIVPGNGVLVQALSTNAASVFIGGASVTTGTGYELQAGQAVPFTPTNVNLLYVIGANNTDKVCWNSL